MNISQPYLYTIITLLFIGTSLSTRAVRPERCFQGKKITPQRLIEIMQQQYPMQELLQKQVDTYKTAYIGLLLQLARQHRSMAEFGIEHQENEQAIKDAQLKNTLEGSGNYGLELPDKKHQIIIAGPIHRVNNLLSYNDYKHWDDWFADYVSKNVTREYLVNLLNNLNIVPTYQALSRAAHVVQAQECIAEHKLTNLRINSVYIAPLTDTPNASPSDYNYMIIEQQRPEGIPLTNNEAIVSRLSPETILQLCKYAHFLGQMWDPLENHAVLDAENNIVFYNIEQANACGPQEFWNKKRVRYEVYVKIGLGQIAQLVKNDSEKLAVVHNYVQTNQDLQTFNQVGYDNIKKAVGIDI